MADETRARRPRTDRAPARRDPGPRRPGEPRRPVAGRIPARETLDRELREIKDNVLRMGSLVEEAIRAALEALVDARRRGRARGHQGRRPDQRDAARASTHAHHDHDRDPGARSPATCASCSRSTT